MDVADPAHLGHGVRIGAMGDGHAGTSAAGAAARAALRPREVASEGKGDPLIFPGNAGYEAHERTGYHQAITSVGKEGQRQTLRGQHPRIDPQAHQHLKRQQQPSTVGKEGCKKVAPELGSTTLEQTTLDEHHEHNQHDEGPKRTELLRQHGVDEVRMGFREIEELLHPFPKPHAPPLAPPKGNEGLG